MTRRPLLMCALFLFSIGLLFPQLTLAGRTENEAAYRSILKILAEPLNQPDSPSSYKRTYKELEQAQEALLNQADLPDQDFLTLLQQKFASLELSHLRITPLTQPSQSHAAQAQWGYLGYVSRGDEHELVTLLYGGPAQAAGLEIGDTVLERRAKNHLVGTEATLRVKKASGQEVVLTMTYAPKDQIDYTTSYPTTLPNGKKATVLIVEDFSEHYDARQVEKAMAEANRHGTLIVDLRGNPGGRSDDLMKYFLKDGSHLYSYLEAAEKEKLWDLPGLTVAKSLGISNRPNWSAILPSQVSRKMKIHFIESFLNDGLNSKIQEAWTQMLHEFERHQTSTHEYSEDQMQKIRSHFIQNLHQLRDLSRSQSNKLQSELINEESDEDELKSIFMGLFGSLTKLLKTQKLSLDQITGLHYPPSKRDIALDVKSLSSRAFGWKKAPEPGPEENANFEPFRGKVCFLGSDSTYCDAQTAIHTLLEYQEARSEALYPKEVHFLGTTGSKAQGSVCQDIFNQYRLCYPLGDILSPFKKLNLETTRTIETSGASENKHKGDVADELLERAIHLFSSIK